MAKDKGKVLDLPSISNHDVPDDWSYEGSLERMSSLMVNWRTITEDVCHEIWTAHKMLSENRGRKGQGFSTWCDDAGLPRKTAYRWLENYDAHLKQKKIAAPKSDQPTMRKVDQLDDIAHGVEAVDVNVMNTVSAVIRMQIGAVKNAVDRVSDSMTGSSVRAYLDDLESVARWLGSWSQEGMTLCPECNGTEVVEIEGTDGEASVQMHCNRCVEGKVGEALFDAVGEEVAPSSFQEALMGTDRT